MCVTVQCFLFPDSPSDSVLVSSSGWLLCWSLQKRSSKLTRSFCGSRKTERIEVRAAFHIIIIIIVVRPLFLFSWSLPCLLHQCPSSGPSTTWALRWWSQVTPWYQPGPIWPSWFTLWTTAAQMRSDSYIIHALTAPLASTPSPSFLHTRSHSGHLPLHHRTSPPKYLKNWRCHLFFLFHKLVVFNEVFLGVVSVPCDTNTFAPPSSVSLPPWITADWWLEEAGGGCHMHCGI